MSTYWDVLGYHPERRWELIETFVDEKWARDFIAVYQMNTCITHERVELRRSEHVESFEVGPATKKGLL